jgi:thiamine pyrophosphokinase
MARYSILLDGHLVPTPRLRKQVVGTKVIAADGGIRHALILNLKPELWIGDFDSTDATLAASFETVPRSAFPIDKDKTDGELAVAAALARGAQSLLLVGALGGRADHTLAHIALMIAVAETGIRTVLSSGDEEAYPMLPGKMEINLPPGSPFSIIALSPLSGLDLKGAKWPLEKAVIRAGSTRAVSNIVTRCLRVDLASGRGVLVADVGPAR